MRSSTVYSSAILSLALCFPFVLVLLFCGDFQEAVVVTKSPIEDVLKDVEVGKRHYFSLDEVMHVSGFDKVSYMVESQPYYYLALSLFMFFPLFLVFLIGGSMVRRFRET